MHIHKEIPLEIIDTKVVVAEIFETTSLQVDSFLKNLTHTTSN
jgi:hypothetical protein